VHDYPRFVYCFFSSRRRHTISKRDWSSDVCSSDLVLATPDPGSALGHAQFQAKVLHWTGGAQRLGFPEFLSVLRKEHVRVRVPARHVVGIANNLIVERLAVLGDTQNNS